MARADEVIPDSQDELELGSSEFQRDLSPPVPPPHLTNATTPSHQTSSFVPPRAVHPTSPSAISQFTMETVKHTEPSMRSTISAFPSSTSSNTPIQPRTRPKPRPTFSSASSSKDSYGGTHDLVISVSARARTSYALPPPQETYSADISERIKARRAHALGSSELQKVKPTPSQNGDGTSQKKATAAMEDVIIITDDDTPPRPSRASSSRHLSRKGDKTQSPESLDISTPVVSSTSFHRTSIMDPQELSPAQSRKRKRHPAILHTDLKADADNVPESSEGVVLDSVPKSINDPASVDPPKKKKKSSKTGTSTGEAGPVEEKSKKKKASARDKEPRKSRAKPKGKEQDHFKSSEYILDSDNELNLGNVNDGTMSKYPVPSPSAPVAAFISTPVGTDTGVERTLGAQVSVDAESDEKINKKRKAVVDSQDESHMEVAADMPGSKKTKRAEEGDKAVTNKQKPPANTTAEKAKEDPEKRLDVLAFDESVVKAKRKKNSRMIIEDEDNDEQEEHSTKENVAPAPSKVSKESVSAMSKPLPLLSKPSYSHPPKNRPLSSILQRVNGSSPRPRASPSVSRNLLTRIAPLHPNRRTPPPPPPPRIVPKKTKKELEREEKWEEELQETVEGWCELEEFERERLRREKRDWELGLCED